MSTNAKIIFGYKDHFGNWIVEKEYIRWSDGYSEMLLPQLKEHTHNGCVDIQAFNKDMKYPAWKLEDITKNSYEYGNMNYHYYIDESFKNEITCTVLKEDNKFYSKYGVDNMMVEYEDVILNE